jgi:hypothetical protein
MTAVVSSDAPAPGEPTPGPARPANRRRVVAMSAWAVAFAGWWVLIGLPATDPIQAFVWLWAATVAWRSDRPWREHLRFARDWAPVVAALEVYNLSRGFADDGATPHVLELVAADKAMFGGVVPTVWLQHHLYDPHAVHWWDIFASWVYFSHFVAALLLAVVLWLRDRESWLAFMRRWLALCAAGLATYFLYPAAPPWWAAQYGLIEPVARISTRGWKAIGLHGAGNLLNAGQLASNPVAAMPSLHSAFALLVTVFLATRVRRRWWPVLFAYPLAMTFTLVYSGEHYVVDVLFGWTYVGLTWLLVGAVERWWGARTAGHPAADRSAARADRDADASAAASE